MHTITGAPRPGYHSRASTRPRHRPARAAGRDVAHAGRAAHGRGLRGSASHGRGAGLAGPPGHADVWCTDGRRPPRRRRRARSTGRGDGLPGPVRPSGGHEFPAALAALRDRLPVDDEPVGLPRRIARRSRGAAGADGVDDPCPGRSHSSTPLRGYGPSSRSSRASPAGRTGGPAQSREAADELDFVARARGRGPLGQPPVLLVSGELDHPDLRTDAAALVGALREGRAHPSEVELVTVPGLAHPLAEEPGLEPAPQSPAARAVDEILTTWFARQFGPPG